MGIIISVINPYAILFERPIFPTFPPPLLISGVWPLLTSPSDSVIKSTRLALAVDAEVAKINSYATCQKRCSLLSGHIVRSDVEGVRNCYRYRMSVAGVIIPPSLGGRSEERRVGKECRS